MGHFTLSAAQVSLKNRLRYLFLLTVVLLPGQLTAEPAPVAPADNSLNQRFVVTTLTGLETGSESRFVQARCVLDKKTSLTWEVKTQDEGLQDAKQTYSWYDPDNRSNGGSAGHRLQGTCKLATCDTQSYIAAINGVKLCGLTNWRLPSREELRSLVDYSITYPGPTINQHTFPNTVSQFYWSSTANANDKETAWGIGFSFGYDYAYFKSDHGYIRLVSGPDE